MSYLLTYLQSNFLEVPFFCVAHYFLGTKKNLWSSVLTTSFANAITHPIVFFVWLSSGSQLNWLSGILAAEAFAVIGEIALHGYTLGLHQRREWFIIAIGSLSANLISWELGPILTWLSFLR
ncbi:MAG: hypothetical protein JNJ49_05705 [Bdellovibrionaceae bacterium]|nr:hypothetical protein [Pseudobdellovibrionaceae bacterium]